MRSISAELRKVADENGVLQLYGIADRIDSEMVELPKDADGVPIHVGDTVWGCVSGLMMTVKELCMADRWTISTDGGFIPMASAVTHVHHDSLACVADELDEWCDEKHIDGSWKLRSLAKRIRKLAEKESER